MNNQTHSIYRNFTIAALTLTLSCLSLLFVQSALAQNSCPLDTGDAYKSPDSSAVWYVSKDCTKRPIKNPAVFFSHFKSWDDVEVVSFESLNRISNNPLGFLPWGQLRTFKNGSLIKTVDDPKVYLLLDGFVHPISSENAYKNLGYTFDKIEDVTAEVLAKYRRGRDVNSKEDYPGSLVFQYENSPRVYLLERDYNGNTRKRYIESYNDLVRDYRVDRIAVLDTNEEFPNSSNGSVANGGSLRWHDEEYDVTTETESEQNNNVQNQDCENFSADGSCEEDQIDESPSQEEETEGSSEEVSSGAVCGNGVRETGEYCDDGSENGRAGECNNSCSAYIPLSTQTEIENCENYAADGSCEENTDDDSESEANTEEETSTNNSSTYVPPAPTPAVNLVVGDTPNSCDVSGYGITGQTHYFCDCAANSNSGCIAGNDTNDGLSPSSPKRSLSVATQLFNSMPAGDSIALCRGGAFDTSGMRIFNQNCTATNRCQLTSYAPTATNFARPIIWSSGNGISFENGGNSVADQGYVITNIDLRQPTTGQNSFGIFIYNDADDIYSCNMKVDGFGIGVHIAGHNAISSGNGESERFEFHHGEIVNNNNQGWLGACDDCVLNTTYFDNNGYLAAAGAVFSHSIYLSGGSVSNPNRNMRVTNNEVFRSVHANNKNSCQGAPLVVHGAHDGHVIENNLIRETVGTAAQTCWGISIDPAYSTPELFRNIIIRNNTVEYVGNRSINLEQCENCTETNNSILYNTTYGS